MGFFESVWSRISGGTPAGAAPPRAQTPSAQPAAAVPRSGARDRLEGVAVRCAEFLGPILANPERVRWALLQPEVDGAARRFATLTALGASRAAEAREARDALRTLLRAELTAELPESVDALLDRIERYAHEHMQRNALEEPPVAMPLAAPAPPAFVPASDPAPAPVSTEPRDTGTFAAVEPAADDALAPVEYELRVVPGSSIADLDMRMVREYVQASSARRPSASWTGVTDIEVLRALRAVEGPPGRERVTVLGGLFFATRPEALVVQSKVRFVEFPGVEVASGEKVAYRYTEEMTGTIPQLIARMERLHRERLAPGVLADGFRVEEVPAVPLFALREAMVNAVCHRDYSLVGANIQVRLFEDRLEVQSPGGLPGPVTVDNILTESYARNPRVADLLRDLGYVERHGLGIDNMVASMREAHLPPPEFGNTDTSFTVTLRFRVVGEEDPETWLAAIGAARRPEEQQRALLLARRTGEVSSADHLSFGAIDDAEGETHLRALVRGGWLVRTGKGPGAKFALGSRASEPPTAGEDGAAKPALPRDLTASLPAAQRRIVELVALHGPVKVSDVLELAGLKDRRSVQRTLAALAERGLVVRHATCATDPGATYELSDALLERGAG